MGSIPASAPYPVSPCLHLRLLGRFELRSSDDFLRARPSGERLLAYLAVTPGPVTRQEAAAALWPDCTEVRAAANLRSVLWRLPGRPQGGIVCSSSAGISLMPELSIDIEEISGHLADGCPADEHVSISTLRQDVLPGWPEHWLIPTREWFRQVRLRALEALCDRDRAAGRMGSALDAALAAISSDPLRESAHRRLALIHVSEGNLAEALRQYHVYRQLALDELGLPPSAKFRQIISPLLGRPADTGRLPGPQSS